MNNSAKKMTMLLNFPNIIKTTAHASNETFNVPEFQRIMKEESFDLIIQGFLVNHFLLGLGDHFKCPTIVLLTAGGINLAGTFNGNPIDVAAVPHFMAPYQGTMNFPQRLKTFALYSVDYMISLYTDYVNEKYYLSNFPPDKYRSFDESRRNISLILVNEHFSQGGVKPLLPNSVHVGGLQVKSKPSPLPERIQKWLDGAEHGAIFFSLGSNAKSTYMTKEKIDALMKVFGKLKQRVIFKWETDSLPGQPDNVITGKWLPQDDILAHKNTKLFISHCGLGGVAESLYHAVPIIAMPLWGDQMSNAERIIEEGWAVRINYATLNEDDLMKTIKEVLENPK
jgi:glucuronosyltransferase